VVQELAVAVGVRLREEGVSGPVGGTPLLEVMGQTVVVTATTDVMTVVPSAVQLVAPEPQLVTVTNEVA
jgi:hypothetical protein